jgi:hypothetical protein
MATKKQLAEQIIRVLSGGTPVTDTQLDPREVMLAIDQARDNMATLSVFSNVKAGEFDIDYDYLASYPGISITLDPVSNIPLIDLPVAVLSLPHELGVYSVSPAASSGGNEHENTFIRIMPGAHGLYTGLPSYNVDARTYYWYVEEQNGGQLFFKNVPSGVTEIDLVLCPSSKELTETDIFLVPPHIESEIIKNVVELFSIQKQIPHDEVSDGVK